MSSEEADVPPMGRNLVESGQFDQVAGRIIKHGPMSKHKGWARWARQAAKNSKPNNPADPVAHLIRII